MMFAPEMCRWSKEQFKRRVYNDDYFLVDPDIAGERARRNAKWMLEFFGNQGITHLDYGGGDGHLSRLLQDGGWNSVSYDPLVDEELPVETFDLVTAFEVFEHAPDPHKLMADLSTVCKDVVVFSTVLNDSVEYPLDWWYLAPRNGHVALYSKRALGSLLRSGGFRLLSVDAMAHLAYRRIPPWLDTVLS